MALEMTPPYNYSYCYCLICGNEWRYWGSAGERSKCEKCEKRREQEIKKILDDALDKLREVE